MNKQLQVKCPQCDKTFFYYESENRPFCSDRCKLIDLGHWFKESYRVPEKVKEQSVGQEDQQYEQEREVNEEANEEKNYYEEDHYEEDYDENNTN